MTSKIIGFIGGGRVTRILLESWQRASQLPNRIVVCDPNVDALAKLKARIPGIETGSASTAANQEVVFLAVHPPVMADVVAQITDALPPDALVVSLAPKFTISKLTELLGGFDRIVRFIPNAPSIINAGFNPLSFGASLTDNDKMVLTALLAPTGDCP